MNKDSVWNRLSLRLEKNQEEYGPVEGDLPLARMGMIWLAANLVVTTQLTGTLFVPGISWSLSVALIILGSVTGGIVLVLVGNIGTRTGLPTMALTKGTLGLRGSYLAVVSNVVILMGWSWVQAMLAGITIDSVVEQSTGFSNPVLFSALCQLCVVCLAILGHEAIAKIEPYLAVVMLAIIGYIFVIAFTSYAPAEYLALPADPALGWNGMLVFDIVVATAISWTVLAADFNRFAASQTAGTVGSGVGYVLSTSIAMCFGATAIAYLLLAGLPTASFDPAVIFSAFGTPFAIAILLSVMATNIMVVYGMVTSVVNASPARKLHFLPTALVLGAISIVGATWLDLLDRFTTFLTLIGALFIPVFAMMIADYYIIRRGYYSSDLLLARGGRYWFTRGINVPSVIIWCIGFATSSFLASSSMSILGTTLPTFFVSFALYIAWAHFTQRVRKTAINRA